MVLIAEVNDPSSSSVSQITRRGLTLYYESEGIIDVTAYSSTTEAKRLAGVMGSVTVVLVYNTGRLGTPVGVRALDRDTEARGRILLADFLFKIITTIGSYFTEEV